MQPICLSLSHTVWFTCGIDSNIGLNSVKKIQEINQFIFTVYKPQGEDSIDQTITVTRVRVSVDIV